jgi:CRISPR-associated endonuclease/helicase Cas3
VAAVGHELLLQDKYLREKFVIKSINEDSLISFITYFLALHDIGKFSGTFQGLVPELYLKLQNKTSNKRYTIHHDDLGYSIWLKQIWPGFCDNFLLKPDIPIGKYDWQEAIIPWAYAITGHHGTPPKTSGYEGDHPKYHFSDDDVLASKLFCMDISNLFLDTELFLSDTDIESLIPEMKKKSWLIAGLAVLCDWIGSDSQYFHTKSEPVTLNDYWNNFALPRARMALNDAGIIPIPASGYSGLNGLLPGKKYRANPLQSFLETCPIFPGPNLYILEESTGGGKTEAAFILAHRLMQQGNGGGIFIGLPTMATANAMYTRMAEIYDRFFEPGRKPTLVLAHSAPQLAPHFRNSLGFEKDPTKDLVTVPDDSSSEQSSTWLADNRKKSLLAMAGVGTIDQALLSVLPRRHQSLRLLGVSRNILIVDEVHAYDSYMNELLKDLLMFQAASGGSAILLSATLPKKIRDMFIQGFCSGIDNEIIREVDPGSYPLVTHVSDHNVSYQTVESLPEKKKTTQVTLNFHYGTIVDLIKREAALGKCVCWVRNTVDDAVKAYTDLSSGISHEKLTLFHARFALGDRLNLEKKIIETFGKNSKDSDRNGQVLVATQVVEQSLDLDFDFMVTDLAPIDLIIQRAGRLHRHPRGDRGEPNLVIYSPPLVEDPRESWFSEYFPRGAYVYRSHGELWLTAKLLAKRGFITMPDDARMLIEQVYGEGTNSRKPKVLRDKDMEEWIIEREEKSFALFHALHIQEGYKRVGAFQWDDGATIPTRLGENSVTVRLGVIEGSEIKPLIHSDEHPWDLSQLSIRENLIASSDETDPAIKDAISVTKEHMPDKGKWSVLLPVQSNDKIHFSGSAKDKNGKQIFFSYDSKIGLRIIHPD